MATARDGVADGYGTGGVSVDDELEVDCKETKWGPPHQSTGSSLPGVKPKLRGPLELKTTWHWPQVPVTEILMPSGLSGSEQKQKKFLGEWTAGYKSAFIKKDLANFWPVLFAEWFKQWLENTEGCKFVKEQLKLWLLNSNKWQLSVAQKRPARSSQTFEPAFLWNGSNNGQRLRQRLRHWLRCHLSAPVSKQIFLKQSPLLQANILQQYENMKAEAVEEDEDDEDADAACAQHFQMGIDSLPYSLEQAGEQILEHTGFISLTMVVGPDPSQGGNILAYRCVSITDEGQANANNAYNSLTKGKTACGCNFTQYYKAFATACACPFTDFAKLIFCKCALPSSEHLRNYEITAPAPAASQASNGTINPQLLMAHYQSVDVEVDNSKSDISDGKFTTPTPPLGLNKARPKDAETVDTLNTSADMVTAPNKAVIPNTDTITTPDEAVVPDSDMITTSDKAVTPNTEGDNGEIEPATPLADSANTVLTTEFDIYSISSQILTIGKCRPKEMSVWLAARKNGPNGLLQHVLPDNNNWTELCKGTINGIYGLMASLGWWLEAAKVDGSCEDTLTKALEDFKWALENMVQVNGHKHKSAKSDDADVPSKKSHTN
ncbi:hypothetical protein BDN71DRAFT_1576788 [Pleurotus eryngii]|uniref:Uncharacterized protein n=1 Tax=Pleurotus eryngii TaxID=5323 RepID=A0A9P6A909_PLEER|nr:hypothetical protein BDN71DRAFT_1576788 [Pleurotus eryngii]